MTDVDVSKRRFLYSSIGVVGVTGLVGCADPSSVAIASTYAKYTAKTKRAAASGAPIDVDINKLLPGMLITVEWRSRPIGILNRPKLSLQKLLQPAHTSNLLDASSGDTKQQPKYARNDTRSRKPEVLVFDRLCTHLGCSTRYDSKPEAKNLYGLSQGGFFCACHGARFDLAGRVYKGGPAKQNLKIPPHFYVNDSLIRIGAHSA